MSFLVQRSDVVMAICEQLRAAVPELKLVKPYHGELDRYAKKTQIKEPIFPAQVNLATPFALVISKHRTKLAKQGASRKFKHDISIYVGDQNTHNFNDISAPSIFGLLSKCMTALDGAVLLKGCGELAVESDGDYLITTDLFVIYDQKYSQFEIGN